MCRFIGAICMEDRDVNFLHSSLIKVEMILMTAKMSPRGWQNHSVAREIAEWGR